MRTLLLFVVSVGLTVPARAQQGTSADSAQQSWTTITYLTGASVYIGAGSRAGLSADSRVDIVRRDTLIAELAVEFVSSTSASCRIVKSTAPLVVGDSARFIRRVSTGGGGPIAATQLSRVVRRSNSGLHGRVGVRQFVTRLSPSSGGAFTQPALDLRVDGQSLAGTHLGLTLDVRAHRTRRTAASAQASDAVTRVYQAAVHLDGAAGPGRLTVGRQFATALSTVGLFDGASADYTWQHTGAGAFAGTQPDAADFGYSSAIREAGAWFRLHNAPKDRTLWSLTTGVIGSYASGEVNREFLYLQGQFVNRALSLFASQEVDYNRGWRADAESTSTTPTSTFLTARLSLGPAVSVNAGYDNRRNVRLYRDFTSPEREFDDSFRQGMWAGTQLALGGHFQAGFDVRSSRGGAAGASDSWTASTSLTRLTAVGLGVRARTTRYTGAMLDGELHSASLELQPFGRFRIESSLGTRRDLHAIGGVDATSRRWVSTDFETGLGRSLFFTMSAYRETGPGTNLVQYFGSFSYRF